MPRSPWSVAASALVSGALLSIAAALTACALSDPAETAPTEDPSLPDVDASTSARPAPGQTATDDGGVADPPPGTKSSPPDAGTPDSGPGPTAAPSGPPKPAQGEVLITEVMYNPLGPEPGGEWIEVHNGTSNQRTLSGLTLVDSGGRTHTIAPGVILDAGAYALLVRNKATAISLKVPAAAILYEYGTGLADTAGILLLNGATGKVSLVDGQTIIAQAPYGGWFTQTGGSTVQLKVLEYATSTMSSSWCLSQTAWTSGSDKGTPGSAGDCP